MLDSRTRRSPMTLGGIALASKGPLVVIVWKPNSTYPLTSLLLAITPAFFRMFELNPNSKTFFGYEEGEDIALENSAMHGRLFSAVFDSIFQTLGPDQEFVEEVIQTVGRKHRVMGICPTYFDAMGEACVHTVSLLLERDMTEEEIEAWVEVYGALSTEMKKVIGETKLTEELAEQVNQQGRVMSLLETQS
mmetsp:Transcript_18674/g.51097  ORF Transcript_18674/g.51097 Transcript_18674/m.51097 type:complete len:191 (-) Transcript_18674:101-673(-)